MVWCWWCSAAPSTWLDSVPAMQPQRHGQDGPHASAKGAAGWGAGPVRLLTGGGGLVQAVLARVRSWGWRPPCRAALSLSCCSGRASAEWLLTAPFCRPLPSFRRTSRSRATGRLQTSLTRVGERWQRGQRCYSGKRAAPAQRHVPCLAGPRHPPADPGLLNDAAGLGIHHAGMLRSDRNLMERAFAQGLIKVLAPARAPAVPSPPFLRPPCDGVRVERSARCPAPLSPLAAAV